MHRLGRVWDRTLKVMAWGSAVAIIIMMALVVVEVTGRKFFTFAIAGTVELIASLLVVAGYLAWAYTESENSHVKVEFVVARMSATTRLVLEVIIGLILLCLFAIMLWQTTGYAIDAVRPLAIFESVKLPIFPFRLIVPLGIFFLILQLLVKLVPKITRLLLLSRNRLSNMRGKEG